MQKNNSLKKHSSIFFLTAVILAAITVPTAAAMIKSDAQAASLTAEAAAATTLPASAADLADGKEYNITFKQSGSSCYLRFIPSATGTYVIGSYDPAEANGYNSSVILYREFNGELEEIASDDNGAGVAENFGLEYTLEAGVTYYYRVKTNFNYSQETTSYVVRVFFHHKRSIQSGTLNLNTTGNPMTAQEDFQKLSLSIDYTDGVKETLKSWEYLCRDDGSTYFAARTRNLDDIQVELQKDGSPVSMPVDGQIPLGTYQLSAYAGEAKSEFARQQISYSLPANPALTQTPLAFSLTGGTQIYYRVPAQKQDSLLKITGSQDASGFFDVVLYKVAEDSLLFWQGQSISGGEQVNWTIGPGEEYLLSLCQSSEESAAGSACIAVKKQFQSLVLPDFADSHPATQIVSDLWGICLNLQYTDGSTEAVSNWTLGGEDSGNYETFCFAETDNQDAVKLKLLSGDTYWNMPVPNSILGIEDGSPNPNGSLECGNYTLEISVNGTVQNRIPFEVRTHEEEHSWSDSFTVDKEPTCTKTGSKSRHCTIAGCQSAEDSTVINAAGHKWTSWKTTANATVLAAKKQSRSCTVCKTKQTRSYGNKLTPTIKLTATSLPLKIGQKCTAFKVTGMARGDSVKSWKSSNTKIVKVSGKSSGSCTITAQKKTGSAKITVTLKSGKKKSFTVKVQKTAVRTKKITGVSKAVTLKLKKTLKLKPVLTPVSSKQKITYTSSNKTVATVSSAGKITAKKKGTATITIKSGSITFKCKVTVKK